MHREFKLICMSLEVEEKCLCYHGPLMYEAKILRVYDETKRTLITKEHGEMSIDDQKIKAEIPPTKLLDHRHFFVHYQGWKSSWDEWVGLDRIRPYTAENLELKTQLAQDAKTRSEQKKKAKKKIVSGRVAKKEGESGKDGDRNGVRDREVGSNQKKPVFNKRTHPKISIKVPVPLKVVLVDDWEYVTKDRKLIHLPCKITVDSVLDEFYKERAHHLDSVVEQSQLSEFLAGLRLYFNASLGKLLLYRLERIQYAEMLEKYKDKQPTSIYGLIHLLRLITLLPEMIETSNVDDQTAKILVKQCDVLLNWIALSYESFSKDEYINTSSQYEGVALNM